MTYIASLQRAAWKSRAIVATLAVLLVAVCIMSFAVGRFSVSPVQVVRILLSPFVEVQPDWSSGEYSVVLNIRLPRILAAVLVGGALAVSGAAYQTVFRNPLVSPDILGVSAAAGFGGSLALLLGLGSIPLQGLAFGFGLLAAILSMGIGRLIGSGSSVVLVLGGLVVAAMFQAMIAVTQYLANPETTLPAITFWLLGSLGRATLHGLIVPALIVAGCLGVFYRYRWQVTVLSVGDDEAATMGVDRRKVWIGVIVAATLMTASVVSIAGIIGWVGLVIPHIARFLVGPNFSKLLPVSTLLGASYLLLVDDVARTLSVMEIPLGVLTALIGAPYFVLLLAQARKQWG